MAKMSWLPKTLRWVFTVLMVFTSIAAVAIVAIWVINPDIPLDKHVGTVNVELFGQPATITIGDAKNATPGTSVRVGILGKPAALTIRDTEIAATGLHGGFHLSVDNARGLIDLFKRYGLPLAFLYAAFATLVFDLFRRLFRNVGRIESFTPHTLRLVQILGLSLLVFSLAAGISEGLLVHAVFDYLSQHATLAVSGTAIRLPQPEGYSFGGDFPFGTPIFFSGLLVLALSEVFRQGLVLQNESDLTV